MGDATSPQSGEVTVSPDDLHRDGYRLAGWQSESDDVYSGAHAEIESAVASGWVGASAAAMSSRVESMRAAAETLTTRMGDHSTHFRTSAVHYTTTDDSSAGRIETVTAQPGESTLNL
ncbi:WXG100 family type VII secretion target [Gordonia sp. DT101]|uniref:WXG100 family type VII secretion target n=1 Tax=Gordonia sp. DT101 TaxID=3416545 RepID=UPI003CFA6D10